MSQSILKNIAQTKISNILVQEWYKMAQLNEHLQVEIYLFGEIAIVWKQPERKKEREDDFASD